jgi:hypothetical protein
VILWYAVLAGIALHAALGLLEGAVPAIGRFNLDPFLRMLPAALAAVLATRASRRASGAALPVRGALAASLTGLLGMMVSLVLGQPHGHAWPALVSVTGTSLVIGALVGLPVAALGPSRPGDPDS